MSEQPPMKKVKKDEGNLENLNKTELISKIRSLNTYVEQLEAKSGGQEQLEKEKAQVSESSRRENVLVMRLANKEQELQELNGQLEMLSRAQMDSQMSSLRKKFLDPSVNLLYSKMYEEQTKMKKNLAETENQLSAWKFTADSQNGRQLMSRCRLLITENQDLGKQLSQGEVAKLKAELAVQKKQANQTKASQEEMNDFVVQLDEEVEGMQSTIQALQRQLIDSKSRCKKLEETIKEQDEQIDQLQRDLDDAINHHQGPDDDDEKRSNDAHDDHKEEYIEGSEDPTDRRRRRDEEEDVYSSEKDYDEEEEEEDRRGGRSEDDDYEDERRRRHHREKEDDDEEEEEEHYRQQQRRRRRRSYEEDDDGGERDGKSGAEDDEMEEDVVSYHEYDDVDCVEEGELYEEDDEIVVVETEEVEEDDEEEEEQAPPSPMSCNGKQQERDSDHGEWSHRKQQQRSKTKELRPPAPKKLKDDFPAKHSSSKTKK